ncbi:hypothetical protein [Nocardia jejuensis]|uniref:hypothetical protein n=1 Tax=Nocardia jejuensis TaxID=328049 RepID=UPI00082C4DCA|nr:hypothetical protein [Nocardia jejuensis]
MATYGERRVRGGGTRFGGVLMALVLLWLIIGAVAAGQRHYFDDAPTNCAGASTIAITILAGPLNYAGVNPKIDDCNVDVPQPSP